MPAFTLRTPDPDADPVDRKNSIDLGRHGLSGYCAATTIDANGEEHYALLRYGAGCADYLPADWARVAAHEIPGLPVYVKD